MNETLISIVVPIYNVEKYLKKCLDSIINQTYKNIEIILINDGSTDNSGKICDNYKENYDNVVVIHNKNRGVSVSRNIGIDKAKGNYITFIDADDYIEPDMIEKLYLACKENNAQISCCGKSIEKNGRSRIVNCNNNFCVNNKGALQKLLLIDDIDGSCCDKLFDKKLFETIKYPIHRKYEDLATLYKLLYKTNKTVHIKYSGYHYIIRENSFTNTKFDKRHLDMIYYSDEIRKFIYETYPDLKEEADSYYYLQLTNILQKIKGSVNFKENKKIYRTIKKHYNDNVYNILKNKYISKNKKIMCVLIYLNCFNIIKIVKMFFNR